MTVEFRNNELILDNHTVELEQPVESVLELNDRVIILLESYNYPEDDPNRERNIVCYDKTGRFLWRIEDLGAMDPDLGENPFTDLELSEDQARIFVWEFEGLRHDLDPDTGRLSNAVITR